MQWYIWIGIGLIFAIIEAITINLCTIWFALAAVIVAFVSFFYFGLSGQVLIFSIISILFLVLFAPLRIKIQKKTKKLDINNFEGKTATVKEDILPCETGKVELQGVTWLAYSESNETITTGSKVVVVGMTGIKLFVRKSQ